MNKQHFEFKVKVDGITVLKSESHNLKGLQEAMKELKRKFE